MVNQELANWIKSRQAQGYPAKQIYYSLVQQGHNPKEVKEAMAFVNKGYFNQKDQTKPSNKGIAIYTMLFLMIIIIVSVLVWFFTKPICGNDKLEKGETKDSCCLDAGCIGDQICSDNVCIEPSCKACQYLEDHTCKDYICCSDADCGNDNETMTYTCKNPSSLKARCTYTLRIELPLNGTDVSIGLYDAISFNFEQEFHRISIENTTLTSIRIIIESEPKRLSLSINETKTVDFDGDQVDDVSITLVSLGNEKVNLKIKRLVYVCLKDSDCDDGNNNTIDKCLNPGTFSVSCSNVLQDECGTDANCNDTNSSTKDVCSGTPKTCSHNPITNCENSDGYCPLGCNYSNDDDCEEISDGGYHVPILVLSYYPLDPINNDFVDSSITGLENYLVSNLKNNVQLGTNEIIRLLKEGSRYRSLSPPMLNYEIYESKEFFIPIPISDNCIPWNCPDSSGKMWYRPDYYKLLAKDECEPSTDIQGNIYDCDLSIDICDYVDNKGVKEVWMWGYHGGITEPVESDMSMGRNSREYWNFDNYGDISNSERIDDLPICNKTYTLYNFNYDRVTIPGNIHNQMHHYESIFEWLDSDLFWNKFVGPHQEYKNDNTEETYYRCGNCHFPPNGASDYDYTNRRYVWTDCFDWKPDGSGAKVLINCDRWDCQEGKFDVLWMQSIPSKDNNLTFGGNSLRNWWEFISNFDIALEKGKCLACEEQN